MSCWGPTSSRQKHQKNLGQALKEERSCSGPGLGLLGTKWRHAGSKAIGMFWANISKWRHLHVYVSLLCHAVLKNGKYMKVLLNDTEWDRPTSMGCASPLCHAHRWGEAACRHQRSQMVQSLTTELRLTFYLHPSFILLDTFGGENVDSLGCTWEIDVFTAGGDCILEGFIWIALSLERSCAGIVTEQSSSPQWPRTHFAGDTTNLDRNIDGVSYPIPSAGSIIIFRCSMVFPTRIAIWTHSDSESPCLWIWPLLPLDAWKRCRKYRDLYVLDRLGKYMDWLMTQLTILDPKDQRTKSWASTCSTLVSINCFKRVGLWPHPVWIFIGKMVINH